MNLFETAARLKLRFGSQKGQLSVEDLWDLPLTSLRSVNLDDIARDLFSQLRSGIDISFVNPEKKSDITTQLKFDIAKYIIDTRLAENAAAAALAANKEKKQHLLSIIAQKEGEALSALSVEELRKMVEGL